MKKIGQARALAQGYYPVNDAGVCRLIEEGETFTLYEGQDKGKWFERIDEPKPAKAAKTKDEPLA